jgi:hypothetical protein
MSLAARTQDAQLALRSTGSLLLRLLSISYTRVSASHRTQRYPRPHFSLPENRKQSRGLRLGVRTSSLLSAHDSRRVLLHLCEFRARQLRPLVRRCPLQRLPQRTYIRALFLLVVSTKFAGGGWRSQPCANEHTFPACSLRFFSRAFSRWLPRAMAFCLQTEALGRSFGRGDRGCAVRCGGGKPVWGCWAGCQRGEVSRQK